MNHAKTRALLHPLPLVALAVLVGCGRPAPQAPIAEKPSEFTIGVSLPRTDEPWRAQLKTDIEKAAAEHPRLKLDVRLANNDPATQQRDLAEFCNRRVNLIIIRPVDATEITPAVEQAMKQGIPVVVLDRALVGNQFTTFIGADPRQLAEVAAQWCHTRLGNKANIVEIRGPDESLWADEVHSAWRAAMKDPGYRFLRDSRVDPPVVDAAKLMGEALASFAKIDVVFAYDDAAAKSAYEVAKAARREKGILFVGIGGIPSQGQEFVKQGILAATLVNPTGGAEAIDAAIKILHGESVPKRITPAARVISRD